MQDKFLYPANAVRVWRGFRSSQLSQTDFFNKLSTVFVPATVEMQQNVGLDLYVPTIPAGMQDKPKTVPDETAILFWNSQQTYHDGFKTLAVRTYTLTHAAVYTAESRADFPLLFDGELLANQPYFLFNQPVDWMYGNIQHLIGALPSNLSFSEIENSISEVLRGIQSRAEVDAAIICLSNDFVVYWQLGGEKDPGLNEMKDMCAWQTLIQPTNYKLPAGLWDTWPGMDIQPGNSFNMQFKRSWE